MAAIKGVIRNGQVLLSQPATWPDGTEVTVAQLDAPQTLAGDDDRPMTPEEIARTLAAMDRVEPFDMTQEELAAWEAERRARKEWEKAHFQERADKLREMWE